MSLEVSVTGHPNYLGSRPHHPIGDSPTPSCVSACAEHRGSPQVVQFCRAIYDHLGLSKLCPGVVWQGFGDGTTVHDVGVQGHL